MLRTLFLKEPEEKTLDAGVLGLRDAGDDHTSDSVEDVEAIVETVFWRARPMSARCHAGIKGQASWNEPDMNVASVGEHGEEAMSRQVDSAMSPVIGCLAREGTGGLSSCVSVIEQSQEGDCCATIGCTWRTKRKRSAGI
jgi:hypothetical protein